MSNTQIPTKDPKDTKLEGMAEHAVHFNLPPVPKLFATIQARAEKAEGVYSCDSMRKDSLMGYFDEKSIGEEEISNFVRYSNPALFEKLGGLEVQSCDLPVGDGKTLDAAVVGVCLDHDSKSKEEVDCPNEVDTELPAQAPEQFLLRKQSNLDTTSTY